MSRSSRRALSLFARPSAAALCLLAGLAAPGCQNQPPAPPPKPAAEAPKPPAPPPVVGPADAAPAKPKMQAPSDGLSLADRIKKREAEENKLAAELAAQENDRLLKYDKSKLPQHVQVLAFIKKTRGQYDAFEKKMAGKDKDKAKAELDKLRASLEKPIDATLKKMTAIDPKGGNSMVVTDYDVLLNALKVNYADALAVAIEGDKNPLVAQKDDFDKRIKKIDDWLAQAKKAKK